MSMLNQAAVEALCSGTYLENYLDTLETLPDDLQRIISQMREVDFQYNAILQEMDLQKEAIEGADSPESLQMKKATNALQRNLIRSQELGDEKLQLSSLLIEYIENRTRQLEQDLENLDPSLGKDMEYEINAPASTVTPTKPAKTDNDHHSHHHHHHHKEKKKSHRRKATETSTASNSKKEEIHDEPPPPKKKKQSTSSVQQQQQQVEKERDKEREKEKTNKSEVVKKKKKRKVKKENKDGNKSPLDFAVDPDEPVYCTCQQVSYGEMIGCDYDGCEIEWFHFNCIGLMSKPKGKWYCPTCRGDKPNVKRADLK